jgi:hypothetical protein
MSEIVGRSVSVFTLSPMILLGLFLSTIVLQGCHRHSARQIVETRIAAIAGTGATDCGRTVIGDQRSNQNACVLSAVQGHRAFRVQYQVRGKDSIDEVGLAGDSTGNAYMLTLESEKTALRRYREYEEKNGPMPLTKCPAPLTIRPSVSGTLSCF